jgi:hypothetical protein
MTRLFICTAVALFMGTIPALAADYSNPSTSQTGQDVSPSTKSAKTPPSGSADTSSGAAQQSSAPPFFLCCNSLEVKSYNRLWLLATQGEHRGRKKRRPRLSALCD